MNQEPETPESGNPPPKPKLLNTVLSVMSAAIGIQTSRNKERDFSQGNYRHFIIGGIVFTVLFVLTVIFVVKMVLRNAGM